MKQPFKTYNGGKAGNGTYQQIINKIPKCHIYIEPMVGNGGVLHNLKLPAHTVINDIDRSIMDQQFAFIRNRPLKYPNKVSFYFQHYQDIVRRFDGKAGVFFYFDPPYHFETRKSKQKLYKYEWTHEQHVEFLTLAVSIKSNCMISHYPCELYDTMLTGWRTHDFESMTRNGLRTERIYMNYPEPEILQDYRYTGTDYRERQRIKRKVARHLKKLEALPNDERNAILTSVMDKFGHTAVTLAPAAQTKIPIRS